MAAGAFTAYAYGVLGPAIRAEFKISRAEFGIAPTVLYLVAAVSSLVAGRLVDRLGAKKLILTSFVLVALTAAAIGLSPSYPHLIVALGVGGLALAIGNPATNKLIAVCLPPGRRGVVMGTKQAGVQLSALAAGALLAPAASLYGWRLAVGLCALVAMAALAFATAYVPTQADAAKPRRVQSRASHRSAIPWLAWYAFWMGSGVAAINTYLASFIVEAAHATPAVAGLVVATVGAVGLLSRIAWGWASDRIGSFELPLTCVALGGAAGVLLIAAVGENALPLAVSAAVLIGATALTWNAIGMLAVMEHTGEASVGKASGTVVFGFFMGFVATPVMFGSITDATGNYLWGWLGVAFVFLLAAAGSAGAMVRGHSSGQSPSRSSTSRPRKEST